jgi:hypothetical protein
VRKRGQPRKKDESEQMKNKQKSDSLTKLIDAADHVVLAELVRQLAAERPEAQRACFEFLKAHVEIGPESESKADTEAVFSLWDDLEPDLAELDQYGGGDYETEDYVGYLLYDLQKKLEESEIPTEDRRALLDEVIPFIRSRNSGMEDALYDVAYAACRDEADWRDLAERLEALGQDWPCDHARRIYRRIGDREKYLELRQRRMEYGLDYHDLTTFYWECGEREQALAVGHEGLEKAKGRMDELWAFMAERAKESGDRQGYLELQFAQTIDRLTLEKYKAFKKQCSAQEWRDYEPRMVEALNNTWKDDQLEIRMHRKEHKHALELLLKMRYPDPCGFEATRLLKVAARLEKKYPEEILVFYISALGNLSASYARQIYAYKARVAKKVRHMWVDVLNAPDKWEAFARKVKTANARRPAFQEEFAKVVPGWLEI